MFQKAFRKNIHSEFKDKPYLVYLAQSHWLNAPLDISSYGTLHEVSQGLYVLQVIFTFTS
jgi:hypothetical protein